jgi:hypothetical protein
MSHELPAPEELVLTEGEQVPPPGPTVPEPKERSLAGGPAAQAAASPGTDGEGDYENLLEVKKLAQRVGGLEKLREMVDVLLQLRR